MGTKVLRELTDKQLDAEHMRIQRERAKAEAKFKAEALEVQEERDRRDIEKRVAEIPDDVKAAIRSTKED